MVEPTFEGKTESEVRDAVADKRFSERKMRRAQSWLDGLERARNDASNAESLRIARSAKNAAWAAVAIAAISMIFSAIAMFLSS